MGDDPVERPIVLPRDLAGEYVDPLTTVPTWWPKFGPPAYAVLVVGGVVWQAMYNSWSAAQLLAVVGGIGVVYAFRTAGRGRTTTTLDDCGATVSTSGGSPRRTAWEEVRGVRVSTRPVKPRLILKDNSSVPLPGLTRVQGRQLAQWLAAVGSEEVVLEVDGREQLL